MSWIDDFMNMPAQLRAIQAGVDRLLTGQVKEMAGIADINTELTNLSTALTADIQTAVTEITAALAAAGIPQSQIDSTVANIKAIEATLANGMSQIGSLVNPPPPTPTP